MKITYSVSLQSEKYLSAIMAKQRFEEVARQASGGMMSDPFLMITYEGTSPPSPKVYVECPPHNMQGFRMFYNINCLEGSSCMNVEDFFNLQSEGESFKVKIYGFE